jgi:predicted nucleic acid-binding protein
MADIIQIRRDTAANWTSANPTLAQGELGLETDTSKIKAGDGSTAWTSLGYLINTGGYLVSSNNLSDIASSATALTNLGLTATATELNYTDGVTSSIQTQLDSKGTVSNLADLSITATATELNYTDGVTSSIQTQLDSKGTVSSLADLSITATATELNYVDGVTSSVQTQLDAKASTGKAIAMAIVFGG